MCNILAVTFIVIYGAIHLYLILSAPYIILAPVLFLAGTRLLFKHVGDFNSTSFEVLGAATTKQQAPYIISASNLPTAPPSSTTPSSDGAPSSTWKVIVGATVGGAVGLAALGVVAALVWRRR